MAEAEPTRQIQVTIRPNESSPPPIVANVCLVNRLGEIFVLDFGFADPLVLVTSQESTIQAAHVGKIVIARDAAIKIRDELNRILGGT